MKTSSAKAKGRRLAQKVKDYFISIGGDKHNIHVTPSGVTGPDVTFTGDMREVFPFAVECKNQESLNIWAALKQAESNSLERVPLLFFSRNRSAVYCTLKAEDFLQILKSSLLLEGDGTSGSVQNGFHGVQEAGEGNGV